jgi:UDP-N-acetyl-D-galactosamine dehydrogenase
VSVHDPVADPQEARHEYGVELTAWEDLPRAEAVVAAVAHRALLERAPDDIAGKVRLGGVLVDVKSRMDAPALRAHGLSVWRL